MSNNSSTYYMDLEFPWNDERGTNSATNTHVASASASAIPSYEDAVKQKALFPPPPPYEEVVLAVEDVGRR